MKALLAVCMMATGASVWASDGGAFPGTPNGAGLAQDGAHAVRTSLTDSGDMRVPKASGANAWTVADIVNRRIELAGRTVLVRGRVVKYNPEIMGRNWVHLRDGTGSALDSTNDLLVTTADDAKLGDIVTARGVVRVDQDFGSGYAYRVLIEEATLQPQPATK